VGAADIVGFAICWVFAAAVLTWGVLSERRRGARSIDRRRSTPSRPRRVLGPHTRTWHRRVVITITPPEPPVPVRPAESDWVVVESLPGSGPQVRAEGELLVAAALAARGLEPTDLTPSDRRVEVTSPTDGEEVTLFLLRAGVLTPAEPA
jgi:hypothetical protein